MYMQVSRGAIHVEANDIHMYHVLHCMLQDTALHGKHL